MIASFDRKGEKPSGYIAVQVTFDTGFNTYKLYTYWVPPDWPVQEGDKLEVYVAQSTGYKWTTIRNVGGLTPLGAEHKCATRYKAMPRDREIVKEMNAVCDAKVKFKERIERLRAYREKFYVNGTATGRTSGTAPDQSNIPKESTMIEVKSVTYLNGKPFENCTDDELFAAIRKDEAEINDLLKIENKPKALKDRITKLEAGIKALVAMMDARP